MQRWTGTWLGGLAAAGVVRSEADYRGASLGLPAAGPGAVASYGRRLGAFILDLSAGALIGGLAKVFVHQPDPVARAVAVNVAFVLEVAVLVALTGQSIGMRLARIRVVRLAGGPPTLLASVLRAVLILLVVPALLADRDGRGLHDKAARTVVVLA
ncbi:MAG: RDD family protein [Actinomycetota bacterium]|nr:RDD family protein [Actinomycetota bacterium]